MTVSRHRRVRAQRLQQMLALALVLVAVGALAASVPVRAAAPRVAAASSSGSVAHQLVGPAPSDGVLHVVALGDSVPAGSGCGCTPFPVRYGRALAARSARPVQVHNDGVPGLTSATIAAMLQDGGTAARDVASAGLVIITIGANDFDSSRADPSCPGGAAGCFDATLVGLAQHLDAILARVAELRRYAPTTVLLTGYWDIWKDGQVAAKAGPDYVKTGETLTRRVNQQLQQAARRDQATYVDLVTPFRGTSDSDDDTELLADDGDHPNAAGHQAIADALLAASSR